MVLRGNDEQKNVNRTEYGSNKEISLGDNMDKIYYCIDYNIIEFI